MREIKFRAWHTRTKWMHDWLDLCCLPHTLKFFDEPEPYILMQYTGLKDKNGIEIYEGDIVVQDCYIWFDEGKPNYVGTVEWIYSQWQVVPRCINPEKYGISDDSNEGLNDYGITEGETSEWQVIGNIYENPELIK